MPAEVKNSISHRGRALQALKEHFMNMSNSNECKKAKLDN